MPAQEIHLGSSGSAAFDPHRPFWPPESITGRSEIWPYRGGHRGYRLPLPHVAHKRRLVSWGNRAVGRHAQTLRATHALWFELRVQDGHAIDHNHLGVAYSDAWLHLASFLFSRIGPTKGALQCRMHGIAEYRNQIQHLFLHHFPIACISLFVSRSVPVFSSKSDSACPICFFKSQTFFLLKCAFV